MKKWIAILSLAAAGNVFAHGDMSPLHGGIVQEGKLVSIEMVAKPDSLTVYLSDHGQTLDSKGVSGEVTLLTGTEKTSVKLAPTGGNILSAKGNFKVGSGSKALVKINVPGKGVDQIRLLLK